MGNKFTFADSGPTPATPALRKVNDVSNDDDLEIPASLRRDPKTNLRPGQKAAAPEAPKAPTPPPPKKATEEKPAAKNTKPEQKKPVPPKKAAKKPLPKKGTAKSPDEIAKAASEKVLKDAEKAAEKAAKEAKAAAEKEAKEKAEAEKKETAIRGLEHKAKEIFVRVEKANKLEGQADDHRVAIALNLAAAKEDCKAAGVKFSEWCDKNFAKINLGYEAARKLASAGASQDEGQTRLAIEDMRSKNKKANKTHRENKKAGKKTAAPKEPKRQTEGSEISLSGDAAALRDEIGSKFEAMSSSDQENFLQWLAESIGATVSFAS
jgi:hypothetical protein